MNERSKSLRISHAGLRGVVGNGLTAAHVLDFAAAFATFLQREGAVVVGRDPRASGVMIREGVTASLMASGRDVIDLGVVSTPVLQHSIRRLGAAGGISIGASHNAIEWNALKFFGPGGSYLSTAEAGELLDIYHLHKFDFAEWRGLGSLHRDEGAIDAYLADLASAFDFDDLRSYRVVVDCCNGTSAAILKRLNELHGFRFVLINAALDGTAFAHEPATDRRTVALQLAPLVEPLAADAGFLFDADSDRVAFASERGEPASEEMVLPMLADHLLTPKTGQLVITNLSTTALVDVVAGWHGGRVVRVPVGRQAAIDALAGYSADQVALAGEGTGAVMMPRFRFVYDGIASMLGLLSLMSARRCSLSRVLAGYPAYSVLKGTHRLSSQRVPALMMALRERFDDGAANMVDGLRVDWEDRWFHVRVSQTEPVIRVIAEQRGAPPNALFESLMDQVRSFM
ncbi:MAG: hypothetical protein FJW40_19145 [Acidobacteria bacterium]|nr:hypothetical protein [Acidobacteriota bacterium]